MTKKVSLELLEKAIKKVAENVAMEEDLGGTLRDIHARLQVEKDPAKRQKLEREKQKALKQLASGRPQGMAPPIPPGALGAIGEGKDNPFSLDEALSSSEIAQKLSQLQTMLVRETDPQKRQKIAMAIQRGNQQLAGGVAPQQEAYMENIKYLVGRVVEDTMLNRKGKTASNKPKVVVPMPKNPIVSPPKGNMGTKEIVDLLNSIEEMMAAEDLSSEDESAIRRAMELMSGVIKSRAHASTGVRVEGMVYEKAPPDPEIEKWINANKQKFIKQYGKEKGMEVLYATAWKKHGSKNEAKTLRYSEEDPSMTTRLSDVTPNPTKFQDLYAFDPQQKAVTAQSPEFWKMLQDITGSENPSFEDISGALEAKWGLSHEDADHWAFLAAKEFDR
jgi:hypothetical protein